MLTWLIERQLQNIEQSFDYDMSYARAILAADRQAFLAFAKVKALTRYRRDVPPEVRSAVGLVATLAEDCGPCTQLGVAMALREGVSPETLSAVLRADDAALPEPVRLGVSYARAVLARTAQAEPLREEIVRRFGRRGLVSLAFAITAGRIFPTLKYALGYGVACQRVVVQGTPVSVVKVAE
jgi:alkylhydroperoxidase family enzyme